MFTIANPFVHFVNSIVCFVVNSTVLFVAKPLVSFVSPFVFFVVNPL